MAPSTATTSDLSEDDLIQLAYLRDVETDALVEAGYLPPEARMDPSLQEKLEINFREAILHVTTGSTYPATAPTFYLENIDYELPHQVTAPLRESLNAMAEDIGATNNIEAFLHAQQELLEFNPIKVVLQLANETKVHLEAYRARVPEHPTMGKTSKGRSSSRVPEHLTEDATSPESLLSYTMEEICRSLPEAVRVLHIESVQRSNLKQRFFTARHAISQKLKHLDRSQLMTHIPYNKRRLMKTNDDAIAHIARTRMTFHGTQTHRVASIVRHGFLLPGQINPTDGQEHGVRCGATYGRGIYSSPDAEFALSYADYHYHSTKPRFYSGLKLIVCATLMGRAANVRRDDNLRESGKPLLETADSHVGNNGYEYIVFSAEQIVPCYVIHLDWGTDGGAAFGAGVPSSPWNFQTRVQRQSNTEVLAPGDRQREKQAIMARASKWFPYGFGPAQGTRFQVLEVAEVSEDEEDYGDYQELRARGEDNERWEAKRFWEWDEEEEKMAGESDVAPRQEWDEFYVERFTWKK